MAWGMLSRSGFIGMGIVFNLTGKTSLGSVKIPVYISCTVIVGRGSTDQSAQFKPDCSGSQHGRYVTHRCIRHMQLPSNPCPCSSVRQPGQLSGEVKLDATPYKHSQSILPAIDLQRTSNRTEPAKLLACDATSNIHPRLGHRRGMA